MNWCDLFCETRLAEDRIQEADDWKDDLSEFEKDYKKIISNAGFRRLQDKTQVFPLDMSDFVRTRLTHSIEVSTIAKQLGTMVVKGLNSYQNIPKEQIHRNKLVNVLMCAGLLHDLGNPPFGHFGEEIIGSWFRKHLIYDEKEFIDALESQSLVEVSLKGQGRKFRLSPQMILDLHHFEGNAQAFRLLSKASFHSGGSNLNLTYAVMSALIKYPSFSTQVNGETHTDDIRFHKFGCFLAEKDIMEEISDKVGSRNASGSISRNPLAFLVEAADDIAYATSDLEDAFKKEKFTLEEFITFFDDQITLMEQEKNCTAKKDRILTEELKNYMKEPGRNRQSDSNFFSEWVNYAKNWLMYVACFAFVHNYTAIMEGKYKHELLEDKNSFHRLSINALKKTMVRFVYDTEDIIRLELSAQTILSFLMNHFIPAVVYYDKDNSKLTQIDQKYIHLISENYKLDYQKSKKGDDAHDLYLRFLMVTDFISGMTDSYAKRLYQELNGII